MKCPNCGAEGEDLGLSSVELVPAYASLAVLEDGSLDYVGGSDVGWDYQRPTGLLACADCGHEGFPQDFGLDPSAVENWLGKPARICYCNQKNCKHIRNFSELTELGVCGLTLFDIEPLYIAGMANFGGFPVHCQSFGRKEEE